MQLLTGMKSLATLDSPMSGRGRGLATPSSTRPRGAPFSAWTASSSDALSSRTLLTNISLSPGTSRPSSCAAPPGTRLRMMITFSTGFNGSYTCIYTHAHATYQVETHRLKLTVTLTITLLTLTDPHRRRHFANRKSCQLIGMSLVSSKFRYTCRQLISNMCTHAPQAQLQSIHHLHFSFLGEIWSAISLLSSSAVCSRKEPVG